MPPVFEYRFTPRFRDVDALGHVNNAVYLSYLEEARVALFRRVHGASRLPPWPFVLKRAVVEYQKPVEHGDEVVVELALTRWGKTSFTFAYEARVDGEIAFTGETVQVYLDASTGRPKTVPDEFRKRLDAALQNE